MLECKTKHVRKAKETVFKRYYWTKLSLHAADREVRWTPFAPLEQSLHKVASMLDDDVTDIKSA